MPSFVLYKETCGTVVGYGAADHASNLSANGIVALESEPRLDVENWRVLNGEVVERLTMSVQASTLNFAANGLAECVLSGLPSPCTVTIYGAVSAGPLEVTDGNLTITSTTPGAIRVAVAACPIWKPWEITINAT